ncbi:MAG: CBS domain-containing protein [Nitrosopumilales archaeon]|nr:MAG: CBS domain-containing protein [Nitrosopumilales archaeon]
MKPDLPYYYQIKSIVRSLRGMKWNLDFSYFRKWILIGFLLGVVAGLGAIVLFLSVEFFTGLFLGLGAGYFPPLPGGFQSNFGYTLFIEKPWMLPLITGLGGLLVGLITTKFSPESEGHGTDAVIDAYHHKSGNIRARVPLVKGIASSITIGSGGSGGTEGPAGQIAAGFGSLIGKLFKLDEDERRIAVAAGLGAGIGSIFKIPLGGAVFSAEVFYRRDFEVRALIPGLVASVTGYTVFGFVFGWDRLFTIPLDLVKYTNPISLLLYALVGLIAAGVSIGYVKTFYTISDYFSKIRIPKYLKPAIGGVLVGMIGIVFPQILGTSYGWLQIAINQDYTILPLSIIGSIVILKILATSLTLGSGGSAGVFGPSMVIGGFLGAFIGTAFHLLGLFTWIDVSSVIIVSMVSFFGATAKTPISSIIMGSELTGGYALLAPMMLATFVAYIMSGQHNSIFRNQVLNRSDSPAHRMEYQLPILRDMYVKDAIRVPVNKLSKDVTIDEALQIMNRNNSKMIAVVNEKELLQGVVYKHRLYEFPDEYRKSIKLESIMIKDPFFAYSSDSLHNALVRLSSNELQEMPVLSNENNKVLGIITIADLVKLYDKEVEKIMKVRSPSITGIDNVRDEIDNSNDRHLRDKTSNKD